jgi:prepilin-type N-terminal cleavage/methylation domain-containing protein
MSRHFGKGFTLLEVLVVIAIIAVLGVLLIPNANALLNRAQAPICSARLMNLWTVFSSKLNDGESWPHLPTNIVIGTIQEEQWWLNTTSNSMGLTAKDWNCPTISRLLLNSTNPAVQRHVISYLPTLFDTKPTTPSAWPAMPWFIEIANVHGNGAQMIRADGAIMRAHPLP